MTLNRLAIPTPDQLLRNAIFDGGFLRNALGAANTATNHPYHNILKIGDDGFAIEIAVAGFTKDEITVTVENGLLRVEGESKRDTSEGEVTYLHQGISFRKFMREFALGENIEVLSASLEHGLLTILLNKFVPEEKRPKRIAIN